MSMVQNLLNRNYQTGPLWSSRRMTRASQCWRHGNGLILFAGVLVRAQKKKDISILKPEYIFESLKKRQRLPVIKECVSLLLTVGVTRNAQPGRPRLQGSSVGTIL